MSHESSVVHLVEEAETGIRECRQDVKKVTRYTVSSLMQMKGFTVLSSLEYSPDNCHERLLYISTRMRSAEI